MGSETTRREVIKASLALLGVGLAGLPRWGVPVAAQGETLVPFTDLPATFPQGDGERRVYDIRRIDGPFTPADEFYTLQHLGHPVVDPSTYRLKVTGLVEKPLALSLDDLRTVGGAELIAGWECSGNRPPLQGLCSNGRWTGVPLRTVLASAGVKPDAREFVFFGADRGTEQVEFRTQTFPVEQQFGRSLSREDALAPEPFLAYALNGEPLTRHQGSPLRLVVPGWYGVANVKWLSQIHAQSETYLGKYQARWYRRLQEEMIGGELKWVETAISRMHLKSFIARVTRTGDRCTILGVVLNDGTPIESVEIKVDDGRWQPAVLDPATSSRFSWKLFRYAWANPSPGEHTLVSRVTDANGDVQPTQDDLSAKKTFLEDNAQFPRKVLIG